MRSEFYNVVIRVFHTCGYFSFVRFPVYVKLRRICEFVHIHAHLIYRPDLALGYFSFSRFRIVLYAIRVGATA